MDYARLRLKRRLVFALLVLCAAVAVFIVRSSTRAERLHAPVSNSRVGHRVAHRVSDAGPTPGDSRDPCDPSSAAYDLSACGPGTYRGNKTTQTPSVKPDPQPTATDAGGTPDTGDPCDPASAAYDPATCDSAASAGVTLDQGIVVDPPPSPSPAPPPDTSQPVSSNCDPNYEVACVPMGQGDVNCSDLTDKNFPSVGTDPDHLDADKDGIACES